MSASSADTIKVVIRCKGQETLSTSEESKWMVSDEHTDITGIN